jgi:peptide/nickel transport system ATP-binding protein
MPEKAPVMAEASILLSVRDLQVTFVTRERTVYAVNGVSFDLQRGEVLAILGESGSGKSVSLRAVQRLLPERRTRISGSIRMQGEEVLTMAGPRLRALRGGEVAMIFQEPATAFDPVYTVGQQIVEAVMKHKGTSHAAARARALELLELVRIPSAARRLNNYPHEMSGGMRQRAMIALALSCDPKILLADEPTTALDATVQIQVLLLLQQLQRELGLGVIIVTHDVGVAIEIADRIAVMYGGQIVESGRLADVVRDPQHPYTQCLLSSTIHAASRGRRLTAIGGTPPNLSAPPASCTFAPRCAYAAELCRAAVPPEVHLDGGRMSRCARVGAWGNTPQGIGALGVAAE